MITDENLDKYKNIIKSKPYFSLMEYGDTYYFGLILNNIDFICTFYDLEKIQEIHVDKFLNFVEQWWWESNRKEPINLFLGSKMQEFVYAIKHLSAKEMKIIMGYNITIEEKKVKKRNTRKRVVYHKVNN